MISTLLLLLLLRSSINLREIRFLGNIASLSLSRSRRGTTSLSRIFLLVFINIVAISAVLLLLGLLLLFLIGDRGGLLFLGLGRGWSIKQSVKVFNAHRWWKQRTFFDLFLFFFVLFILITLLFFALVAHI